MQKKKSLAKKQTLKVNTFFEVHVALIITSCCFFYSRNQLPVTVVLAVESPL